MKLLWLDLEMTGLDVEKEVIIETAAIVTDLDLNALETYHAVLKQDQKYLDGMDEWNRTHHKESGLTGLIPNGKDPAVVESELLRLVDKHFPGERAVLAGNSIGQDRLFINKYFKRLSNRLHYRMLDVTAWKIVFLNKFKLKHEKKNTHRALDDIFESIDELKFYLNHISVPAQGSGSPSTPARDEAEKA